MDACSVGAYTEYPKDPPEKIIKELIYYTEVTIIAPRLSKKQEPFVWGLAREAVKKNHDSYIIYPDGVLDMI
jgi:hypothetical protein